MAKALIRRVTPRIERAQIRQACQLKQAQSLCREGGRMPGNGGNKIAKTAAHFKTDPHSATWWTTN